jgi:hypothetical protein
MHRLRTKSAIHRFRLAAILLCLQLILAPLACGILIHSFVINDRELTFISLGILLLALLGLVLQCLISRKTHCPLCMTAVLASRGCAKHRQARTFLGSHRLRVALAILFKNSFRCPYCHEPTVLQVRGNYRY